MARSINFSPKPNAVIGNFDIACISLPEISQPFLDMSVTSDL